jgi:hypothetical protein
MVTHTGSGIQHMILFEYDFQVPLFLDWSESLLLFLLHILSPQFRFVRNVHFLSAHFVSLLSQPQSFASYTFFLCVIPKIVLFLWYAAFLHPQSLPSLFIASFSQTIPLSSSGSPYVRKSPLVVRIHNNHMVFT